MSSTVLSVPTIRIGPSDLENLVSFLYTHEHTLKQFGGIKIQLSADCSLALKKRRSSPTCNNLKEICRVAAKECIYSIEDCSNVNLCEIRPSAANEETFWTHLSNSSTACHHPSVSILPEKSLFYEKWHRKYFSIHSVPRQSLLKLVGTKMINQFMSSLFRAHGPGATYPLSSARRRLFSLVYHHQGGPRHWYIIPAYEREALTALLCRESGTTCFEHKKFLIDPQVLDKHHIRYHRIIQYPNDIIVLSAGTVTQSFTEDASWSESIDFALPCWIEDGHASVSHLPCCPNPPHDSPVYPIDLNLFHPDLIQKFVKSKLNRLCKKGSLARKGLS